MRLHSPGSGALVVVYDVGDRKSYTEAQELEIHYRILTKAKCPIFFIANKVDLGSFKVTFFEAR